MRPVKPYTDIAGLENVVLDKSYVLAIAAAPVHLLFHMDFVVTPSHWLYEPPGPDSAFCYRRGDLSFGHVESLHWSGQGATPSRDPDGKVDYGQIDYLMWAPGFYRLEGDWGYIEVAGDDVQVTVTVDDTDSPA